MGETGVTKTMMIAGGGTGGHIYPAIAIARGYVERDPSRRVVFVGTEKGLEKTIVPKAGFPLEFSYGWEWPTRRQWAAGQRYGYCWAPA